MGHDKRLENCFRDFDEFLERVIEEHVDEERERKEHEDIIDVMLQWSKDETASIALSRDHIKAVLFDIFIGGKNTKCPHRAMAELIKNPRIMQKAEAEIGSSVGAKHQVSPHHLTDITYLKLIMRETFRVHPRVPLLLPRLCVQHCDPPNTVVFVNAYAIGRDPKIWKKPSEFYPERFEEENDGVDFKGQHYELIPFGAAPGCLFDWELPQAQGVEEQGGLTIYNKHPLYLVPVKHQCQT